MSDKKFQGLARKYLADMICAQNQLQRLHHLFSAGKDVQRYQCDFVISALTSFTTDVQLFASLLRNASNSSLSLSMRYYTLILTLDQLDDQEQQIKLMINGYRPHCQLYSKQVLKQKHEIQRTLKKFVQHTDTFLQQVSHLLDEHQIPEKKPVIVYPSDLDVMQQKEGVIILLCRHFTPLALPATRNKL